MSGPDKEGWYTTMLRLPLGRYQYKFVAVGQGWRSDPGNIAQVGARTQQRARGWSAPSAQGHPPRRWNIRRHVSLSAADLRENGLRSRGTFNGWKPTGHEMQGPDADGWYTTTISLPEGRHEYKFVVDGTKWVSDPGNPVEWGKKRNSVVWARP